MNFDPGKLVLVMNERDERKMISFANTLERSMVYVNVEDYSDLVLIVNGIIENIYKFKDRAIQEAYFDVLKEAINNNYGKIPRLSDCIDKMIELIINNKNLLKWEIAESLLVISTTMDNKYMDFMSKYRNDDDEYVKEIVDEYFEDLQ